MYPSDCRIQSWICRSQMPIHLPQLSYLSLLLPNPKGVIKQLDEYYLSYIRSHTEYKKPLLVLKIIYFSSDICIFL